MKVLHIIGGGDIGGAKTHVLSLVAQLVHQLDDVVLVALRDGEFADDARAMGIPVEVVYGNGMLGDIRRVAEIAKEHGCDLIHSHGAKANLYSAILRKITKLPVVTTVHSDYRLDYLGNPIKQYTNGLLNTISLRFLDAYIGVTDRFADMLISRGFDPYHVHVIYNGLDFSKTLAPKQSREDYLRSLGIEPEDGLVICSLAARFHPVKDIGTILRALAKVKETCPKLKLILGGDGEEAEFLKRLTVELGISDRVVFAGWISDMDTFLNATDISLLSSLSESFPYSVLESVRAKCAMVTSAVGGMPVLIDHGVNGMLFNPQDVDALASHLQYLYENPNVRQDMAERLLEKASREYSLEHMVGVQCKIYESVLHTHRVEQGKLTRVTICGSYGRGNAGDDAILKALIGEFSEISPDIRVCVMSRNPKETRMRYRVNSIYTFNPLRMAASMLKSGLFVNGGGSLIQDSTSSRSLYFYLFTILSAKLLGCPVMMYGSGIGPVFKPRNRKWAAKIIDFAVKTITLRDPGSLEELRSMNVTRPKLILAADPTFSLPKADQMAVESALFSEGIQNDAPRAAFAIRKWRGGDDKLTVFAKTADRVYEEYGLIPTLIPMEREKDLPIAEEIARRMKHPATVISGKHDVFSMIGILSRMKLIVGMRLHALVFGASQGVPIVAVSYDDKVTRFMEYIGGELCIPYESVTEDALMACIARAQSAPEKLSEVCEKIRIAERENLYAAKEILHRE
ncbi:MAG: polysaccharide pyruvyl transferase CsaB [Ruminococcaceae bacterium]|nr:polysaccharide pyruvyl transferase CsaB [Oscillospiraceae bacterium]